MEHHSFGKNSVIQIETCEPLLQKVVYLALKICKYDMSAVEGLRSKEQQVENIEKGVSWTMDSRHIANISGLSEAIDIYPYIGGATNHDETFYRQISKAMFEAAGILGVHIRWGGFWQGKQKDMPHWEFVK